MRVIFSNDIFYYAEPLVLQFFPIFVKMCRFKIVKLINCTLSTARTYLYNI